MPGVPVEYFYPFFAVFMLILTVVFVPREYYRQFFWPSMVWGFSLEIIFVSLSRLLGMFRYVKSGPFVFMGTPIWIALAWLLSLMLFFYFLPNRRVWYVFPVYILMFSFGSAMLGTVFSNAGLLIYQNWTPFYRFLVAIPWWYGAAKHYKALSAYDPDDKLPS